MSLIKKRLKELIGKVGDIVEEMKISADKTIDEQVKTGKEAKRMSESLRKRMKDGN